ncbi:30S ribosomal protein S16 [Propioniciclava flava]|uniref:Small ribosomal subunit protein bS16 n=1 Tax=Propioniciclava flava TaxID=2072026 RepID=A0A4Q2EGJ0_9ACTN|nr:30S ribosomal protein S16 [Propioniciclava flava]RXW32163.1 30S ribosomal protein S16 [Propioniciclava flava]
MAVKIRLKRMGKIRNAQYRIVVMDSRTKRDGRAIEEIGIYQPKSDPSVIEVKSERALYWLGVGAQPSETVVKLLTLSGDWQKFKGTNEPSGIKPQPEKADKLAAFNKALAEADDEPASGAITSRKAKAAEAEAETEAVDEAEAVVEAAAEEA